MTTKIQRTLRYRVIAIFIAMAVSQAAAVAQGEAREPSLVGVWEVRTVPRNCVTGNPIPTAAFQSLFTFHGDGTMLVSIRNPTADLERIPFHGLWRRERGWSDYSFKHVHLRRSVPTGLFAGKQEGEGVLTMSEGGDTFSTDGSTTVFSVDRVPGSPSCANSYGTRFKF